MGWRKGVTLSVAVFAGARWAGVNAAVLGFSHTTVSRVHTNWSKHPLCGRSKIGWDRMRWWDLRIEMNLKVDGLIQQSISSGSSALTQEHEYRASWGHRQGWRLPFNIELWGMNSPVSPGSVLHPVRHVWFSSPGSQPGGNLVQITAYLSKPTIDYKLHSKPFWDTASAWCWGTPLPHFFLKLRYSDKLKFPHQS